MTARRVTGVDHGTMQMDKNFAVEAHTITTHSDPTPHLEFSDVPYTISSSSTPRALSCGTRTSTQRRATATGH